MNRYLKIFLAAASGAFVLLATVYLFRGVVIAPQLEKFLIQTASSAGIALTIKKTTGNYFSDLTFSEIEAIKTDNSAPQSAIRIKQISFRYDLKGLIHGLKPFISGLDIDIRQAEGSLNLDAITADNAAENQARQPSTYDWYPTLIPQIAVHDSTVSLVHNQQIIAINGINLALESGPTDKSRNVSLSINQISSNKKDTGFSMDSLRGQLALSRESILVSDLFLAEKSIIQTATIDLTGVGQDNISFTLTSDFLNGPLAMTGSIEKNLLHLQFDGQKLQLDNIAALGISPSLKQVEGVLDISGSLSLDIAKPDEFGTELTMNLHNGRFQDLFVDRFSLVATKTDDLIQLGRMNLFVGNNDLSVENAAIPYPALLNTDMVALTQQSKGSFSVSVKDLPALLKSVDYTPPAPLKTSDVYSIALSGNVDQGIVDISEGNILADTGSVIVQHSVINLSHTPIEPSTIRINTSLAVRISDLHAFLSPFAITDIYGSAEGRMTINGLLTDFTGSLTAKGQNLAYKQIALGNLDLQARASSGMINLESFSLNKDRDSISGSGTINIQKKTIDSLILQASFKKVRPYLEKYMPEKWPVTGALSASLEVEGEFMNPEAGLTLSASGLTIGDISLTNADLVAHYANNLVSIEQLTLLHEKGKALMAGTIDTTDPGRRLDISFKTMTLESNGVELTLENNARLLVLYLEEFQASDFLLSGKSGTIEINGTITPPPKPSSIKIHSHLHSSDEISTLLSLEQLFFKDLDVDLEFSGPLNRPLITLQGTISEIGRTDAPFPLTGAFDLGYSDKGIIINKMSWWVQDNQRINLTGTVPYDPLAENKFLPGNLSLQGHMEVADLSILGFVPFLHDIRGGLSGSVKLAGTWDNPLGSLQIKTQQFSVPSLYAYMPEKTINLEIEATLADQTLSVTRLLAESPSLFITGSGKWSEFPALPQVVKGDPQLVTGNLKGQGKLKVSNMSWLGQKITGIRRLGGLLEIDGFVEGPVSDPSISGALTITNGEIRPDYAVPSIRNFTLRADISKKFLTIKECHGEVGGAPFIVSGQIDSPWGENAVAGLELQGDNLLFFRNDGIKLRGDTEIKVSGPIDQLQITGILKITDGKFTRNFDFLGILKEPGKSEGNGRIFDFSFLDPPLNKAYFNLDIQSKKPFLIKNNLAKGSLRPEMKIVGYGDLLTLRGYLYLDLIKIKLPAGNFFIKSGIVHFPDNDPDRPTLKINGSSQLLGYDISVAIQGYYDEPEITLSSSPPLPNDELLLLLLAGKTPKSESMAGGITQSGMNVAVYLGRDLLEKWFSDQSTENDESLLDRFEIEIGKRVTRSGDETINSQFLITDNFIKKGNALYLSTERDVFDDFNAGLKLMFKFK